MDPSLVVRLGEFAAGISSTPLPATVRRKVGRHFLDTLGVAVAGHRRPLAQITARAVGRVAETGGCAVWGHSATLNATGAAFANGVAAHCLDFDDTHLGAIVHPSAVVIPAALATAELLRTDIGKLSQAVAVGWEVMCRLGLLVGQQLDEQGLHVTAILGPFGAAAATGCLLGFAPAQFSNAFGLCCSQAAGTHQSMLDGSWNKAFHAGWASQSGLTAAFLAGEGFVGTAQGLDGKYGLLTTLLPYDSKDWRSFDATVCDHWRCLDIAIKAYSCCHLFHACLDCVDTLVVGEAISIDQIDSICCVVPEEIVNLIGRSVNVVESPHYAQAALFSLPVCAAMRACGYAIEPKDFSAEVLRSEPVERLAAVVECRGKHFAEYPQKYPGEVAIQLKNGSRYVTAADDCRAGSNEAAMLTAKFCRNVDSAGARDFATYILSAHDSHTVLPSVTEVVLNLARVSRRAADSQYQ